MTLPKLPVGVLQWRKTQMRTNFSVEDFFLSVSYWLDDFEEGLEEPEITQSPCLIIKLLPLCFLRDTDKDVGALLLQQMVKGVLPGLLEEIMLDCDQRGLPEALQCKNHAIWQEAVHQDARGHQVHPP